MYSLNHSCHLFLNLAHLVLLCIVFYRCCPFTCRSECWSPLISSLLAMAISSISGTKLILASTGSVR